MKTEDNDDCAMCFIISKQTMKLFVDFKLIARDFEKQMFEWILDEVIMNFISIFNFSK